VAYRSQPQLVEANTLVEEELMILFAKVIVGVLFLAILVMALMGMWEAFMKGGQNG